VSRNDLVIAGNTIWVVFAAVLVMFMQAGFAFLEAGMTRMKNAAHVAGKNVLTFALCALVYWAVGFGLAFGEGNSLVGTSGFVPSAGDLLAIGKAPYSFFTTVPASAAYMFEVVFAGVSVAIVWGGMAERAKLWVYFAFGAIFTLIYSVVSHWVWDSGGWLFGAGMQDFAGSTVVHYQGALAALAGALILGPRIGRFGPGGENRQIAGHNVPYAVLGVIILWFGWFGFNPGSTLATQSGDKVGYFAYVATTTNLAAAAGGLGGLLVSWLFVHKKPDLTMMLNGVLAALVAITAACGFVAPWAAVLIGFVAGGVAVWGIRVVEAARVDDPIGAVAVHGMAGVWGTLATGLFAVPSLAANLGTGQGGFFYTGSFHQLGIQAAGLAAVGAFTFGLSFATLYTMDRIWGIRVEEEVEIEGLDLAEHGTWGYPEFGTVAPATA
jgi:ammonium transporter, Amt family